MIEPHEPDGDFAYSSKSEDHYAFIIQFKMVPSGLYGDRRVE